MIFSTALARATERSKLDLKALGRLRLHIVGVADDVDRTRFLVERGGDSRGDRLEFLAHIGAAGGKQQQIVDLHDDVVADRDDVEAAALDVLVECRADALRAAWCW